MGARSGSTRPKSGEDREVPAVRAVLAGQVARADRVGIVPLRERAATAIVPAAGTRIAATGVPPVAATAAIVRADRADRADHRAVAIEEVRGPRCTPVG